LIAFKVWILENLLNNLFLGSVIGLAHDGKTRDELAKELGKGINFRIAILKEVL